jgi:hypothetical protein
MPEPILRSDTFPYTRHFKVDTEPRIDKESFAFTRDGVFVNGEVSAAIHADAIRQLQNCMVDLIESSESYDFVATFALGGVFPLNFMARAMGKAGLTMSPEKFHLFAGLLWEVKGFSPVNAFCDWLGCLPNGSKVLVFDTGNDGNAGGRIRNIIRDHYADSNYGEAKGDLTIDVRVIATKGEKGDKPASTFTSKAGKTATVDLRFLWIENNPFEDAVHYIGYESLRQAGQMKAAKYLGGVVVEFETHSNALLSADTAGAFMELFLGKLKLLEAFRM